MKPRLSIKILGRNICSFHLFGTTGFILGTVAGIIVAGQLGLQPLIVLLMSLTGAFVFFLLAFAAKWITGKEIIVYYHHEIAILIACSLVLAGLGKPVLSYLDITILGIATFLAFGRIGCFNVGCCHGRPLKKGVKYGHEHVKAGFTYYYEDIPLLPVQLIESIFVFAIIVTGIFLLLQHYLPGTVLIVYTVIYGAFRFIIEFFRGDPERPYWKGLSEAQWTTLLLIAISVGLAAAGMLPMYAWHIIMALLMALAGMVIVLRHDWGSRLTSARHIKQIASILNKDNVADAANTGSIIPHSSVNVYHTRLRLNLSKGQFRQQGTSIKHYTVSCRKSDHLTLPVVEKLAGIIQQLQKHPGLYEIREKNDRVFHILFRE